MSLLNFVTQDMFETNKIDNNRELSDNSFWVLLKYSKEINLYEDIQFYIWTEIVRNLRHVPDYADNFEDQTIVQSIDKMA